MVLRKPGTSTASRHYASLRSLCSRSSSIIISCLLKNSILTIFVVEFDEAIVESTNVESQQLRCAEVAVRVNDEVVVEELRLHGAVFVL